jgi:hypothetical protein
VTEEWRSVVGWEDLYEISSLGQVRVLDRVIQRRPRPQSHGGDLGGSYVKRGHLLSPHIDPKTGYRTVHLQNSERRRGVRVHILVLEAFKGPRPPGYEACHGLAGVHDNSPLNLRWDHRSGNVLDQVRDGVHHNAAKTHCKRGHRFTPENTYLKPTSGARQCRRCVYEGNKARLAAKSSIDFTTG